MALYGSLLTYDTGLCLLNSTALQARYQLPDLEPAALAHVDLNDLLDATDRVPLEQLVYRHRVDKAVDFGLVSGAYRAALAWNVISATARWYASTFVESIFFGVTDPVEFISEGTVLGPMVQGITTS